MYVSLNFYIVSNFVHSVFSRLANQKYLHIYQPYHKNLGKGPFVFVSTLGNIVSLSGACFLSGPRAQARKMFHETRRIASMVYLSSMVVTLVVAFVCTGFRGQAPVMILLMLVEYAAVTWYCLSYIPFARDAIKKFCIRWWREVLEE